VLVELELKLELGGTATTTGKTLVMESSPETSITQDFNPFVTTAAWGMGATGLIYEPLIQFDLAAPPKYYPWLATSTPGPTAARRSPSRSARA
jgi:ABC-type transport system substrate-binding protein